jgi:hypothetical protein
MVKRKRKPKKQQEEYPGWMWMLFGLAIGLSVAFAIYRKDFGEPAQALPVAQQPASMAASLEQEPLAEPAEEEAPESRFYF